MSSRESIIHLPNKSLRTRSRRVGLITDEIRKIIDEMKDATIDWEASRKHEVGVALAAVQINKLYRIVIIRNNCEDKNDKTFSVFINPEIVKFEGDKTKDHEGCLSVKDLYGLVPRYNKIKVKATDENGKEFRATIEGFIARVMQHEIDHTNGIVYIDHIKNDHNAFFRLSDKGQLEPVEYEEISKNSILWQ